MNTRQLKLTLRLLLAGVISPSLIRPAPATELNYTRTADVPYATQISPRLVGDFYQPRTARSAAVVLLIHGGGWASLEKSSLAPIAELMAQAGFAVYAINYRRLPESPWPACLHDCITALSVLRSKSFRAHFHFAAQPVVIAGASAGAHLALMTGLSRPPGEVAAILAFAGPARLAVGMPTNDKSLFTPAFFANFFGRSPVSNQELQDASPLNLIGPASPPLWLIHSRNDHLVPLDHSVALADRYHELHLEVHAHYFNGADSVHGIWQDNAASPHVLASAARAALEQSFAEIKASLADGHLRNLPNRGPQTQTVPTLSPSPNEPSP